MVNVFPARDHGYLTETLASPMLTSRLLLPPEETVILLAYSLCWLAYGFTVYARVFSLCTCNVVSMFIWSLLCYMRKGLSHWMCWELMLPWHIWKSDLIKDFPFTIRMGKTKLLNSIPGVVRSTGNREIYGKRKIYRPK